MQKKLGLGQTTWKYKLYIPLAHAKCPQDGLEPEVVTQLRIKNEHHLIMECGALDCPSWIIPIPDYTDMSDSLGKLKYTDVQDRLTRARLVRSERAHAKRLALSQDTDLAQEPQVS